MKEKKLSFEETFFSNCMALTILYYRRCVKCAMSAAFVKKTRSLVKHSLITCWLQREETSSTGVLHWAITMVTEIKMLVVVAELVKEKLLT